jgi:hypothetical protein
MFSWQVSQASDPTNVAPGMLGGASRVRLLSREVQESKITVSATPPPAAQQSFSRFPLSHRDNLECSTIGAVLRTMVRSDYAFLRKKFRRPEFLRRFHPTSAPIKNTAKKALLLTTS